MTCPHCWSENFRVVDTMHGPDGNIYRRKKCSDCEQCFRTVEILDDGSEEFKKAYREAGESKSPTLMLPKKYPYKRRVKHD